VIAGIKAVLRRLVASDVGRDGGMVLVATVAVSVANFLFYSLAGRFVDVVGYGTLMSLVSLALIVTAPAMVAQNTLGKLTADIVAAGDLLVVGSLARKVFSGALTVAAVLFAAAIVMREPLAHLVHVADPLLIPLAALAASATFVVPIQRGVLQGAGRFGDLALSMLLEAATRMIAIVPLARAWGARGGLVAFALSMLLPLSFSGFRTARLWPAAHGESRVDLRRFLRAAVETGSGFLAVTTMLYFDVVLVRHYFDAYDAGLYSAASVVGRAIFTGVAFIPMVLIPKIVHRRASSISVRPIAALGIAATVAAALVAIAIVIGAPVRVVSLVSGAAYAGAAPYLLPYAVAVSALAGANVAAAVRVGLHRFAHVVPLIVVALAEIGLVAVRHATITDVLWIIVVGHGTALLVTIVSGLFEPAGSTEKDPPVKLAAALPKN
jgi:O-antigen/teichoic acid export membrane protein